MVDYMIDLYFDRAMFRNNPIFAMNTLTAIDDHIVQAINNFDPTLFVDRLEINEYQSTPDTLAVYIRVCDDYDSDDLCIYGNEYYGAARGMAEEIERVLDLTNIDAEVDIESLPEY